MKVTLPAGPAIGVEVVSVRRFFDDSAQAGSDADSLAT
jgi:hypothetical protein